MMTKKILTIAKADFYRMNSMDVTKHILFLHFYDN